MHTQTEITHTDSPKRLSSKERALNAPVYGIDPDAVCIVLLSSGDLTTATEIGEINAICDRELASLAFDGASLADMM